MGLNSDNSVKKLKGRFRPIINQFERSAILSSFEFIDRIVIFEEKTPIKLIRKIKPSFIFKGDDYKMNEVVGNNEIKKWGGSVILIECIKNKSSSKIIERIKMELSAVFFDVDGTVAETENYHRKAFNDAFKEFNLDWFWDEPIYKELINVGGGKRELCITSREHGLKC